MGLIEVPNVSRYGRVVLEQGRVISFKEKDQTTGPGLINGGIYYLNRKALFSHPSKVFSLEKDLFPSLAHEKLLEGIPLDTDFIDIGIPEDYKRFCAKFAHQ